MAATGVPVWKNCVDDVFAAYTYVGDGSGRRTISNGIDLAGRGGMVWFKNRGSGYGNFLQDTSGGVQNSVCSNANNPGLGLAYVASATSTGYIIGSNSPSVNAQLEKYVSWTFLRAPRFFDVVNYVGNGVHGRQIPHNLGVDRGILFIKRLDSASNWSVRAVNSSLASFPALCLNTTSGENSPEALANGYCGLINDKYFNVYGGVSDSSAVNGVGGSYVAYLFAHDPSPDGIIKCGTFATDSNRNAVVELGWEPQFILVKNITRADQWYVLDIMRGAVSSFAGGPALNPNNTNAEQNTGFAKIDSATGFSFKGWGVAGDTFIYMAIRRSNKPPTSGVQVYNAIARTGSGLTQVVSGVGFVPDMLLSQNRSADSYGSVIHDRLRNMTASPANTGGEFSNVISELSFNGAVFPAAENFNSIGNTYIDHFFKRAVGFFDVVCYAGTGIGGPHVLHSLGVQPELIIAKARNSAGNWVVDLKSPGYADGWLSGTAGFTFALNSANSSSKLLQRNPNNTSSFFTPAYMGDGYENLNALGSNYVAYLFATLPGISKVGSYHGNGSSQPISCDFRAGARFILIKRIDAAGDWFVWDATRGIVAGNDPHLSLNTAAVEMAYDDSVDPYSMGFIINQVAATNINVGDGRYVFLAIA
jgi:hypothetical protein